jgi:hypothetical protein
MINDSYFWMNSNKNKKRNKVNKGLINMWINCNKSNNDNKNNHNLTI